MAEGHFVKVKDFPAFSELLEGTGRKLRVVIISSSRQCVLVLFSLLSNATTRLSREQNPVMISVPLNIVGIMVVIGLGAG